MANSWLVEGMRRGDLVESSGYCFFASDSGLLEEMSSDVRGLACVTRVVVLLVVFPTSLFF